MANIYNPILQTRTHTHIETDYLNVETDYLNVPDRLLMSLVALPRPLAQTSRPAQPPPCRPAQPPRGGSVSCVSFYYAQIVDNGVGLARITPGVLAASLQCTIFSCFCNIFLMFSSKVAIFFEDYRVCKIWRPAPVWLLVFFVIYF